jgi:hypothetical protein
MASASATNGPFAMPAAMVFGEELHAEVIRDLGDSVDALGGLLWFPPLPKAVDRAAK